MIWPDRVSVSIPIIIKTFVHTQVPVSADYDMVKVDIVQNRENVVLEKIWVVTRDQRVAVFNFGTDRVRVLALHFYQSGIIGY